MNKIPEMRLRKGEGLLLLLLGFMLLATFYNLSKPPLMDIDEATYAENIKEFVKNNDFLTPYFRGKPAFHKPPFHLWNLLASQLVFGFNEFAVRLVPAAYEIGILLLVFLIGSRFYSRRVGIFAALILAANPGYYSLARHALTDMTLSFYITLAFYAYIRRLEGGPDFISFIMLYVAVGLATLTKGPIGVGIPFSVFFLAHLISGDNRGFWKPHIIPGVLVWAAVALPWWVIMYKMHGWIFIDENLISHNFNKFLEVGRYDPGFANPFFLAHSFLWYFLPWNIFFIPAALRLAFDPSPYKTRRVIERILLLWFFFPFIVFSFSKFKLPTYMAPGLPACALITAAALDPLFERRLSGLSARLLKPVAYICLFAAGASIWYAVWFFFPPASTTIKHLALMFPVIAAVSIFSLKTSKNSSYSVAAISLALAGVFLFSDGYLEPRISKYSPFKSFGLQIKKGLQIDEEFGPNCAAYRTGMPASIAYYAEANCWWYKEPNQVDRLLQGHDRPYIFTPLKHAIAIQDKSPGRFEILEVRQTFPINRLNINFLHQFKRAEQSEPLALMVANW